MVSATQFFADDSDLDALLDYLRVGTESSLLGWPVTDTSRPLSVPELNSHRNVLVSSATMGDPVFIDADSPAAQPVDRASLFNLINLEALRPAGVHAIIDLNASPVLFWRTSSCDSTMLRSGDLGTQADSPLTISTDYDRWCRRVASWIRRNGARVWGLEGAAVRPDLDIELSHISSVYALPGALRRLENGLAGR